MKILLQIANRVLLAISILLLIFLVLEDFFYFLISFLKFSVAGVYILSGTVSIICLVVVIKLINLSWIHLKGDVKKGVGLLFKAFILLIVSVILILSPGIFPKIYGHVPKYTLSLGLGKEKAVDAAKSGSYFYDQGGLVYSLYGNTLELGLTKMTSADPRSFEVISQEYAKDRNKVYYKGVSVYGADPATFIVQGDIAKDFAHVFLFGKMVSHLNPKTIRKLASSYYRDNNDLYLVDGLSGQFSLIPIEDPHSFRTLANNYFSDDKSAYYRTTKIIGADAKTFASIKTDNQIGFDYAMDKSHVYFGGKLVSGADPETFKVLKYGGTSVFYGKDKNACYSPYKNLYNDDGRSCRFIEGAKTVTGTSFHSA